MLQIVFANEFSTHRDTEISKGASVWTQDHVFLKEHTAQDYNCMSHSNFFCVKTGRFLCIRVGMCITEVESEVNLNAETLSVGGWCPYFPHDSEWCSSPLIGYYHIPLSVSVFELTNFTCSYYNREGLMCSHCQPGYGPAAYAFSLKCAKCTNGSAGWILYFTLTLIPVTVFYFNCCYVQHSNLIPTSNGICFYVPDIQFY